LALVDYKNPGVEIQEYEDGVKYCSGRLIDWAKSRKKIQFGSTEDHHYPSSTDGSRGNKYLFFVPDCMVAYSLLKLASPKRTRRYVLRITRFFVDEILNNGGFIPVSLKRKSAINHLWIYRLLEQFKQTPVDTLEPQPFYVFSSAPNFVRLLISLGYLAVGGWGVYEGILHRNTLSLTPVWQLTIWSLAAAICIPLFVRTIWDFFLRGDD
jgi:hypothetical protein